MQNSKPIRKINSEDSEEKELAWSEATSCDMGDLLTTLLHLISMSVRGTQALPSVVH